MDDQRVGLVLRAIRRRRGWRQVDLARASGLSRGAVSLIERGHLDSLALRSLRRVGAALDLRFDLIPRWRGGELDRFLDRDHAGLAEAITGVLVAHGWLVRPELSFSRYGERGVVDLLAWHPNARALLVVELKTQIVDVQAMLAAIDRKCRLAPTFAPGIGWHASAASALVVVLDRRTSRRRAAQHRQVLRSALPIDGRGARAWLRRPQGVIRALAFWPDAKWGSARTRTKGLGRVRVAPGS